MFTDSTPDIPDDAAPKRPLPPVVRLGLGVLALIAGVALAGALLVAFTLVLIYPNLPTIDTLTDYRPKIPLRVYSADNVLIGEFGEEHRNVVRFSDIPDTMKKAVLA